MAPGRPGDLTSRIERELGEGRPREDILRGLVAGGLSRAGAERFLERVQARLDAGEDEAPPPRDSPEPEGGGAWGSLVQGAFWLSMGSCATAATWLLAEPGQKYVVAYGAVVAGVLLLARGLYRWRRSSTPFPGHAVAAAAGLPLLGAVGIVAFVLVRESKLREPAEAGQETVQEAAERRRKARREPDAAALARRAQKEKERDVIRQKAREEAERQAAARAPVVRANKIERALGRLAMGDAAAVCRGAQSLASLEAHEAIPDLEDVLYGSVPLRARACTVAALAALGETETVLEFSLENVHAPSTQLRQSALLALGELGPDYADVSLPFLEDALASPEESLRYAAVGSLAKMGAVAEPLLRRAVKDREYHISARATTALKKLGE